MKTQRPSLSTPSPQAGAAHSRPRYIVPALVIILGVAALVVSYGLFSRPVRGYPDEWTTGAAADFNVVVVTLDTTRADRLGCYGYEPAETPTLDKLASEGVRFTDAISPVPMTLPSHASMFTGLEPYHHEVRANGEFRLDPRHETLAERLNRDQSAAFVSAFVLDKRFGLAQGFSHYDDVVAAGGAGSFGLHNERSAKAVTDAALAWLQNVDHSRPFFLWVHYFDPHHPYAPPAPYAKKFAAQPYDGELAFTDFHLGRLFEFLQAPSLRTRTILIVAGDHGESLGEHHEQTHSRLIYEATQHVPLIVWSPGIFTKSHVVADSVVSLVGLTPTILDLLGLPAMTNADGKPWWLTSREPNTAVYMETMATYLDNGWAPLHGLRRHNDKLILAPKPEYYDLRSDPAELKNLYGTSGLQERTAIAELMADLGKRLEGTPSAAAVAAAAMTMDVESRQRLEALGYVGGAPQVGKIGELDPKDMMPTWNVYLKVHDLVEQRQFDSAIALAKKALAVSPNDRGLLLEMGKAYAYTDQTADAEAILRKHIAIRPEVTSLLLLSQVMIRLGRLDEAAVMLDQASLLEPEHGGVFIAKGDIAAVRGDTAGAWRLYSESEMRDPHRAGAAAKARKATLQSSGSP